LELIRWERGEQGLAFRVKKKKVVAVDALAHRREEKENPETIFKWLQLKQSIRTNRSRKGEKGGRRASGKKQTIVSAGEGEKEVCSLLVLKSERGQREPGKRNGSEAEKSKKKASRRVALEHKGGGDSCQKKVERGGENPLIDHF